jgi:hypothetical protein
VTDKKVNISAATRNTYDAMYAATDRSRGGVISEEQYRREWFARRDAARTAAKQRSMVWLSPSEATEQRRRKAKLPKPTRPQALRCECCHKKPKRTMHLDHCHATGAFRGWLCVNCNTAIGKLGDNLAGVLRAVEYLRKNDPTAFLDEAPK